jgi:hypothetical protein
MERFRLLVFSAVALASSSQGAQRPPRQPRPQLVRVWGAWAAVRAAASELVLRLPSFPAETHTESAKQR